MTDSVSSGRTVWWSKDAGWWRREYVVELGEEFGPAGPAVLDWLACEASAQNAGGVVKTGYRSLSRGCFVDVDTARHVVSHAVTLGALDDLEGDERRFVVRVSGWKAEQDRGKAAERQRRKRERDAENAGDPTPDVTPGHATSRPVTPGHKKSPTSHHITEEQPPLTPEGENPPTPLLAGLGDAAPKPKHDGRKKSERAYDDAVKAWAAEHFPGVTPSAVAAALAVVRSFDGTRTITPKVLTEFVNSPGGESYRVYFDEQAAAA